MTEDYLEGRVNIEGLQSIFTHVDANRSSILEKQAELQQVVKKFPRFRAGILHLATTSLQLGKTAEALETLTTYHALDPNDATVEYYLAALSLDRLDYLKAWEYLKKAEALTLKRNHKPKALKALKSEIRKSCPDPSSSV
jgi:tetratricopeptide (TPR) repeat protein